MAGPRAPTSRRSKTKQENSQQNKVPTPSSFPPKSKPWSHPFPRPIPAHFFLRAVDFGPVGHGVGLDNERLAKLLELEPFLLLKRRREEEGNQGKKNERLRTRGNGKAELTSSSLRWFSFRFRTSSSRAFCLASHVSFSTSFFCAWAAAVVDDDDDDSPSLGAGAVGRSTLVRFAGTPASSKTGIGGRVAVTRFVPVCNPEVVEASRSCHVERRSVNIADALDDATGGGGAEVEADFC